MSTKPVMNIDDVDPITFGNGGRFEGHYRWMSQHVGARNLGYNHVVLAPGKTSFPYHYHRGTEEAFFVVEGTGVLRQGGAEYPLRPGDVVACPPGSASAHQITNNSEADLKYLAISTKVSPDIVHYPDSNKIGLGAQPDPDAPPGAEPLRMIVMDDAGVDYWEGEG